MEAFSREEKNTKLYHKLLLKSQKSSPEMRNRRKNLHWAVVSNLFLALSSRSKNRIFRFTKILPESFAADAFIVSLRSIHRRRLGDIVVFYLMRVNLNAKKMRHYLWATMNRKTECMHEISSTGVNECVLVCVSVCVQRQLSIVKSKWYKFRTNLFFRNTT